VEEVEAAKVEEELAQSDFTEEEKAVVVENKIPVKNAKKARKLSPKSSRKLKSVVDAVESETKVIEDSGDSERAREFAESIDNTTDNVLNENDSFEKKYGVSAIDLLNEYNSFDKYGGDIDKAYENITGKPFDDARSYWARTDEQKKAYNNFLSELVNEVSESGLKFKNKVGSDSQLIIQPTSKKATVSKKSGVGSLQKVVANDEMRPNLQSVYFEEGNMIATDANQLVIIKQKESNDEILNQFKEAVVKRLGKLVGATQAKKEAEKYLLENKIGKDVSGKILDFKSGTVVDGKYPNYKAVIPYNTLYTGEINIQELIDLANGTNNVFKNIDSTANGILFDFKDGENVITIGFNPEILLNNLQALQSNGSTKVELGVSAPNRALTIKTDNGNFGLVMPLMLSEEGTVNRTLPIPIDVNLSEEDAKKEIDRLKKSKTDGFYARELAQAKKDKDEDDIKRYSEKVKEEEAENKARISDIEKRIKEASKTKPESVSIADKIRSLKVKCFVLNHPH